MLVRWGVEAYGGTQWGSSPGSHRSWFPELEKTPGDRDEGADLFVGEYEHSLDAKGRVVLPAPFRAHVAERGYVTVLDGCLGLWSESEFERIAAKAAKAVEANDMEPGAFRRMMRKVREVRLDAAGRITLPRDLLDGMGFESQVVLAGGYKRVEIWPKQVFEETQEIEESADSLASSIVSLGFD